MRRPVNDAAKPARRRPFVSRQRRR
jgi:hypothetical protein